ncbi:MAG: hypothetical protein BWZ02_01340 [Lentisphaerae bacterium ADurb.BinA184]|nr:MAG: hypothetical protein BWZ02_01340 [Lentisphaerae bacterium ADurb.BinA184]
MGRQALAAEAKPAVLFAAVRPHAEYVAKPLHALGIELASCRADELGKRLASGQFNVVVLGATDDETLKAVVEQFLQEGGGVFLPAPFGHLGRAAKWFPTPEWAGEFGARMRWHECEDTDAANAVVDSMGVKHSFSNRIAAPFNEGARGVLTVVGRANMWPPLAFDFDEGWSVVVRWAESVRPKAPEAQIGRLEAYWWKDQPLTERSGLLGVRQVGDGRLAVCGIPAQWLLTPPANCPTVEATLSAGVGERPSDWLRVFANTLRWLAEPSLKAGRGGATTPPGLLVSSDIIPDPPPIDWSGPRPVVRDVQKPLVLPAMEDLPQVRGLVGARTELSGYRGTVAEYAAAARAAGLDYIVFLENALQMDQAKFDAFLRQCEAASDGLFGAIPGLTIEDAQGNHFFYIGDNLKFPKPDMVLPDGRLATTGVSRTEPIFKYGWQYLGYRVLIGWWNHAKNHTPIGDYKLYNSFPIYSFEDGKPVDSAFAEYLHLTGWGGCQMVFALELMSGPEQVAKRAAEGWQTVATLGGEYGDGTYVNRESYGVAGLRERWKGAPAWYPPYLYITNGPRILCWTPQNNCVVAKGDWWRPDLWQYRARLHVASDVGVKCVTVYDGDRGVFRRWLPNGAKDFEHTLVLANNLQRDLVLVVEDLEGRQAVSMELWNRNTTFDQVICGDRCNFLGTAFLRRKDGTAIWHRPGFRDNAGLSPNKGAMGEGTWFMPAAGLSPFPTLPIDGQPQSLPTPRVETLLNVPGEHREIHSAPSTYLFSPEYAVGQGNFAWAYDPAEYGAARTPLGHDYQEPVRQGQIGKNAWTSWYRLVPTKLMTGWVRLHATQATLGDVRYGRLQLHLAMKADVPLDAATGWDILTVPGPVQFYVEGQQAPGKAGDSIELPFRRGTVAVFATPGGTAVLCGDGEGLTARVEKNAFRLAYTPAAKTLKKDVPFDLSAPFLGFSNRLDADGVLDTLADFGLLKPGQTAYEPVVSRGMTVDTYGTWNVAAKDGAFEAALPGVPLAAMISLQVGGLNDGWSAFLQDRRLPAPNFRPIPVRDATAYALVDPTDGGADLFAGHPVVADAPGITILVAWMEPGKWFIEAHNPTDAPMTARLRTSQGWSVFAFEAQADLPPGASRTWTVFETAE